MIHPTSLASGQQTTAQQPAIWSIACGDQQAAGSQLALSTCLFNLEHQTNSYASWQLSHLLSMLTEPVLIPVDVLAVCQTLGSAAHDPAAPCLRAGSQLLLPRGHAAGRAVLSAAHLLAAARPS